MSAPNAPEMIAACPCCCGDAELVTNPGPNEPTDEYICGSCGCNFTSDGAITFVGEECPDRRAPEIVCPVCGNRIDVLHWEIPPGARPDAEAMLVESIIGVHQTVACPADDAVCGVWPPIGDVDYQTISSHALVVDDFAVRVLVWRASTFVQLDEGALDLGIIPARRRWRRWHRSAILAVSGVVASSVAWLILR